MEDSKCAEGNQCMKIEELDPTFLFTWKGTRYKDECVYQSHDHLEMAVILSGTGKYRFEDGIIPVQEGDLLIINPGVKHQALFCPEAEQPATEFFVGAADLHLAGLPENALPVPAGGHILHTTGELRQKIFKVCASMEAENAVCRQGRYFMMKAYLIQMILLVIREQCEPAQRPKGRSFETGSRQYLVEQILDYIEEHYKEKLSLDQIAENMYLSPFYISKIFKSETGDAPIRHLINIRLEKAREMLENGWEGSIQEAAAAVGYDDAYHFSKLFKKKYGISPSQARKKA
ncbi:MAG: AraC family transcriptional regulator [Roseburia sp.]|nr:AraC family transcriptional regulator [Roseburia sp.]MCM1098441.1 AraC family transcriptional regulator [Ruminococcus flavefaciens]